jgi:hypothetical protein
VNLTHGGSIVSQNEFGLYGYTAVATDIDGDGADELYISGPGVIEPTSGEMRGTIDRFDSLPLSATSRGGATSSVWGDAELEKWGRLHRDIIVRFGRFPHRNPALGRATTPEEQAFLDEGGFGG